MYRYHTQQLKCLLLESFSVDFHLCLSFFSPQASDDTHIMFINTIHNNDSDIITRNYINITFVCRYPINYMVQQPNGENMIRVDVRQVFFKI